MKELLLILVIIGVTTCSFNEFSGEQGFIKFLSLQDGKTNNAFLTAKSERFGISNQILVDVLIELQYREGFREKAYKCPAGVWTIAFGHTGKKVKEYQKSGEKISYPVALELLQDDLYSKLLQVKKKFPKLNAQKQLAVAMLGHNVGVSKIKKGTKLFKYLNRTKGVKHSKLKRQWKKWSTYKNKRGKRVQSTNLLRARTFEVNLFNNKTAELDKNSNNVIKGLQKKLNREISSD